MVSSPSASRQSLVTPIDWKRVGAVPAAVSIACRQSLVTPIDWKLAAPLNLFCTISHKSPILGDAY